ncbi:hypothetical protein ACFSQ7_50950 [Paenibacillus rhizoplanae]
MTAADLSGQLNSGGYLEVKGKSNYTEMNLTIEGIGTDAYAYGWGAAAQICRECRGEKSWPDVIPG